MTPCSAVPDRSDPKVMCCRACGLFWETTDPTPAACRAARSNGEIVTHGAVERAIS
jgi:hypothetical protein